MTTSESSGSGRDIFGITAAGDCFPQIISVINDNCSPGTHLTISLSRQSFTRQIKDDIFSRSFVYLAREQKPHPFGKVLRQPGIHNNTEKVKAELECGVNCKLQELTNWKLSFRAAAKKLLYFLFFFHLMKDITDLRKGKAYRNLIRGIANGNWLSQRVSCKEREIV